MVLAVPAVAWAAERSVPRLTRPHAAERPPGPHSTAPSSAPNAPRYAVGVRTLVLSRGADRPLRTLLFYPASGPPRLVPAAVTVPATLTAGPAPTPAARTVAIALRTSSPPAASTSRRRPATVANALTNPPGPTAGSHAPGPAASASGSGPSASSSGSAPATRSSPSPSPSTAAVPSAPSTAKAASSDIAPASAAAAAPASREPCPATLPGAPATALPGQPLATPAPGRFPLVLFSHGLAGTPERYAPAAATWAAAGFVVAVPAFPHTCAGAPRFRRSDIVHQPADARYVLKEIRRLDRRPDDPLYGRIDRDRVAAVGHSAGGYTTTGLFTAGHPRWLRAGVVIAGWRAPGAFAGRPAPMLFLQGDSDHVVPLAHGRAAFDAVPWPKSYVLIPRAHHAGYMLPGRYGWKQMNVIVTDFLRWALTHEEGTRWRLPASSFPATEKVPEGTAPPSSRREGGFHRPFEDRP
ncbi:platelet-activating factor acetylhydrolase isoform II [Krasilnikovia cinnamomea]|uniref:Platelet-activating factor acetylhydrolase isoform II n=2 Tax=Krasilnikovia cinnamomea TaxID=349313 RepID=A0A4Q7ZGZ1_9ACTN|nr:platelet-activating factor acetylhydrolase isoform II [Krasilnikovia cinnamomea]